MPEETEFIERAKALAPRLAERAAVTEKNRCVPVETIREFREAGFFRLLQPRRWGGYEVDPKTFFETQIAVATACPSSGWVLGVVSVHAWQLAVFPLQAQEEVWGKDSSVLISSSYMPVGKVTRADGGFRLSGQWGFSSGCDHCDWAFLGAFVPPEDPKGPPDMRTFLVPKRDYTIVDDWHVSGLRGTGSKTVVVKDAFVPEYRTHKFSDGFRQQNPGNEVNPAPLYRLPFGQIFVRSVSTSAIGMLQGALHAFRDVQSKRVARGDGATVSENQGVQMTAARAAATVDHLKLILHRNFDEMMGYVRRNEKIPLERRIQFRYESSDVVVQAAQAIDELLFYSGGSGIFLDNPINRYFQDIHAARAHHANNPDKPGRNWGAVQMGLKNTDFFI